MSHVNLYDDGRWLTHQPGSIGRARSGVVAIEPIKSGDTDDEDNDSDESDRKSKMSFSYWGADKITVDPVASAKARAAAVRSSTRKGSPLATPPYTRTEVSNTQANSILSGGISFAVIYSPLRRRNLAIAYGVPTTTTDRYLCGVLLPAEVQQPQPRAQQEG